MGQRDGARPSALAQEMSGGGAQSGLGEVRHGPGDLFQGPGLGDIRHCHGQGQAPLGDAQQASERGVVVLGGARRLQALHDRGDDGIGSQSDDIAQRGGVAGRALGKKRAVAKNRLNQAAFRRRGGERGRETGQGGITGILGAFAPTFDSRLDTIGVGGAGKIFRLGDKAEIVHVQLLRFAADCGNDGLRSSYGPNGDKSRGNTNLSHALSVDRRPDGGLGDPDNLARLAINLGSHLACFPFALYRTRSNDRPDVNAHRSR